MNYVRLVITPLFAALLLLAAGNLYFLPALGANLNEQAAHPKRPAGFHYVCPMHEDVKSKTPGKCPKCKMKLEKKRIKRPESTDQ
jgi:hypothetical protein